MILQSAALSCRCGCSTGRPARRCGPRRCRRWISSQS